MISFKEDHTAGEAFQGSADPGQVRRSAKSPINFYKGRYDIMAKVGLKDTLALLAKGYSKKDIDELAAIDEAQEEQAEHKPEEPAKNEKQEIPEKDPTEDLKAELEAKQKELEELQEKLKTSETKVTKLQQDNVHSNSAPAAAEAKKQEQESLTDLVRSFM